jgi:hypothetical protein
MKRENSGLLVNEHGVPPGTSHVQSLGCAAHVSGDRGLVYHLSNKVRAHNLITELCYSADQDMNRS